MLQPVTHSIRAEDFGEFIRCLLDETAHGSILVFRHKASRTFVQFAKYIYIDGTKVCLHYGFPNADWSANYFKAVEGALRSSGLAVNRTKTNELSIPCFLEIDWENPDEKDIQQAIVSTIKTFEAFGVSVGDDKFSAKIDGSRDKEVIIADMKQAEEKLKTKKSVRSLMRRSIKKSIENMERNL